MYSPDQNVKIENLLSNGSIHESSKSGSKPATAGMNKFKNFKLEKLEPIPNQ